MSCYSPILGWRSRSNGGLTFRREESNGEKMTVSCGGCIGCRDDRAREWAARIVHEAQMHDENCFLTLTYDEDKMPRLFAGGPGTLVKEHFQKFMKRLRKRLAPRKIRYYMCGEYGDNSNRPHYHAAVFGFDPDDKQLFSQGSDHNTYTSKMISDTWGFGFITVGDLTFDTASYMARYVFKKVTGHKADDHYERRDDYGIAYWLEPEYNSMSLKPGIGAGWYEKYKEDVFPSSECPVPGVGVLKSVPRYYETILKSDDLDQHEQVKAVRKQWFDSHKEDFTQDRLMSKYKVHIARNKLKKERDL